MGAKIRRPELAQSGADVKHKRNAEPLTVTEKFEDVKASLFKD